MKTCFWIFNILTFLSLLACQANKETVVEKHYMPTSAEAPLPPPPKAGFGGIDGAGGGNGVEGKPLESFQVDLKTISAFQKVRSQIIEKLIAKMPRLAAELLHIAEERNWYIIPIELSKLPSVQIGAYFPTEQFALQGTKEIWMNDLYFSKMTSLDQEKLILHELLMGVRLLEFSNVLDQCLIGIAVDKLSSSDQEKYLQERSTCFRQNRHAAELGDAVGIGRAIQLSDEDYRTIRHLTGVLMEKPEDLDAKELEDYMAINKFRKY